MRGKTCVVTGATGGIGLVTAEALAALGARVVLVSRSAARGEQALEHIRRTVPGAALELLCADLSAQAEVRRLAGEILALCPRVEVLVNNAGALFQQRRLTADGLERTFALNHLAYFLLTNLLLERLRESGPARVVNVASRAHERGRMRFDDLNAERGYRGWRAYCMSKLANVLFTRELAARLDGSDVTANCLHPGFVSTGFALNNSLALRVAVRAAMWLSGISPQAGARTSIYLASSDEVQGSSGRYFVECREVPPAPAARDAAAAARLWQISEELTGLRAA